MNVGRTDGGVDSHVVFERHHGAQQMNEEQENSPDPYDTAWRTMRRRAKISACLLPVCLCLIYVPVFFLPAAWILASILCALAGLWWIGAAYLEYPCPRCHYPFTFSRHRGVLPEYTKRTGAVPQHPNFYTPFSPACLHCGLRRGAPAPSSGPSTHH